MLAVGKIIFPNKNRGQGQENGSKCKCICFACRRVRFGPQKLHGLPNTMLEVVPEHHCDPQTLKLKKMCSCL